MIDKINNICKLKDHITQRGRNNDYLKFRKIHDLIILLSFKSEPSHFTQYYLTPYMEALFTSSLRNGFNHDYIPVHEVHEACDS